MALVATAAVPLMRAALLLGVRYQRALDLVMTRRLDGHQDDRRHWFVDADSLEAYLHTQRTAARAEALT